MITMDEKKLKVFIDGVTHYFTQLNLEEVVVGTPYLAENQSPVASDYTGIIGVSGTRKGIVYFTSPKDLLVRILKAMHEPDHSEANLIDLVGEVANTISGNARSVFGVEFDISIPIMVKGAPNDIYLPPAERSFVVPIEWCGFRAALVVCIRQLVSEIEEE